MNLGVIFFVDSGFSAYIPTSFSAPLSGRPKFAILLNLAVSVSLLYQSGCLEARCWTRVMAQRDQVTQRCPKEKLTCTRGLQLAARCTSCSPPTFLLLCLFPHHCFFIFSCLVIIFFSVEHLTYATTQHSSLTHPPECARQHSIFPPGNRGWLPNIKEAEPYKSGQ